MSGSVTLTSDGRRRVGTLASHDGRLLVVTVAGPVPFSAGRAVDIEIDGAIGRGEVVALRSIPGGTCVTVAATSGEARLRSEVRRPLKGRVYIYPGAGSSWRAEAQDISVAGLGVLLPHPVERGLAVLVRLTLPPGHTDHQLRARVVHCTPEADQYRVGLAFERISAVAARALVAAVGH